MNRVVTAVVAIALVVLTGCNESPMADMPDFELEQKYAQCLDNPPTAPGYATACENMRKECEARAERGNFVCRKY